MGTSLPHDTNGSEPKVWGWIPILPRRVILLLAVSLNIVPIVILRFVGTEMIPFFTVIFLWIAVYIILLGILLGGQNSDLSIFDPRKTNSLLSLIIITILARLLLLGTEVAISLDPLWYLDFGKFMLQGDMPYADFYFPYPPVFGYFIMLVMIVSPTIDSFRIIATIFDAAIVFILYKFSKSRTELTHFHILPLAYALFPIAIIESGFNGHFEPIANLFLILAIWFVLKGDARLGGVFLGLSTATKIYAGFLIPVLLFLYPTLRKKTEFIIATLVTGIATFIPFSIPVWLRGDLIPLGAAMPGSSSGGFFESVFGFLFHLEPVRIITVALVGVATCLIVGIFLARRLRGGGSTRPLTYDILFLSIGIMAAVMALIATVYPFTPAAFDVYWRYPADIGLVRGISVFIVAIALMQTVRLRWKDRANRLVGAEQKILLSAVVLMLLLTISRDVFYGWYLLWAIPPLLMRDRRLVITVVICMLFLYPSFTHDNFANLGYSEEKTWRDDFVGVDQWTTSIDFADSGLISSQITVDIESIRDIGVFTIDASRIENDSLLENVTVNWSRDVSISITQQTEFVDLISASWDPTFGRYAEFGLYFEGRDELGHVVNGTIIAPEWSPSNITFVLWRFAFSSLHLTQSLIEVTKLTVIASALTAHNASLFIDIMYTTEFSLMRPESIPLIIALVLPNVAASFTFRKSLEEN